MKPKPPAPLMLQIKARRKALGLKQNDMLMRVGMLRQQYQHLESKGNPRLDTLTLLSRGLNAEIMLIPIEKLDRVLAALNQPTTDSDWVEDPNDFSNNPWQGLLDDLQDDDDDTNH